MAQRFFITPDPAVAGQKLQICYVFTGLTPPPAQVIVTVDYSPASVPDDQVVLDPDNPCADVTVPSTATSGFLIDGNGDSDDFGFAVKH